MPHEITTDVLVAGGGPCGLMLANELGRRGVRCLLVDPKPGTAFNPQANATQARTMEHYRRLGFAHKLRAMGLPADYPTDISYYTRYSTYELARFKLPSARAATDMIKTLTGSWSAAEPPRDSGSRLTAMRMLADAAGGLHREYWRRIPVGPVTSTWAPAS